MRHVINQSVGFRPSRVRFPDTSTLSRDTLVQDRPVVDDRPASNVHARRQTVRIHEPAEGCPGAPSGQQDLPGFVVSLKRCLPRARFFGGDDVSFRSIAASAKSCQPGQLVVYRLGEDDPNEVIADALARGAAGILTEQLLPAPLPQCIVADTETACATIAVAQRGAPDEKLILIGVAGSAGKTTTGMAIAGVLRDAPCRVAVQTDLERGDGVVSSHDDHHPSTTGDLIESLNEAADAGAAVAVVELNNNALRRGSYESLVMDVLVITGRNSGISDFGPSLIECGLEQLSPDGMLIIPHDDDGSRKLPVPPGVTVLTYGVDVAADVSLQTIEHVDGQLTAMVTAGPSAAILESRLAGGFGAESLAAAAAVGVVTDHPLTQIAESLSRLDGLPGRCQTVRADDWAQNERMPTVVLDVGGTPERLQATLHAVGAQMRRHDGAAASTPNVLSLSAHRATKGAARGSAKAASMSAPHRAARRDSRTPAKLWCVLAVNADDDEASLMNYGQILESRADQCVLTVADEGRTQFLKLSHQVLDGVRECASMRLVANRTRAIQWAIAEAKPQDTVLIIGGIDTSSPGRQREQITQLQTVIQSCLDLDAADTNDDAGSPTLRIVG